MKHHECLACFSINININKYLHNLPVQLLYEKAGFVKAGLLSVMMNITLMFVR